MKPRRTHTNPERDRLRKALRHIRFRAMDGCVASEAADDPAMALWEIDMILREIDEIALGALRDDAEQEAGPWAGG
jgi:hypothetical protein